MTWNKSEIRGISIVLVVIVAVFVSAKIYSERQSTPPNDESGTAVVELPSGTTTAPYTVAQQLLEGLSSQGDVTELIIQDAREGTGAVVEEGSVVTVHYVGVLTDGTEFDNSRTKERPFTFTVGKGDVIKGWDEGLIGMKEGGSRILIIPSHMAYGNNSLGPIPPRSTLLFAIELLEVQ